jgi:hypothetical protein
VNVLLSCEPSVFTTVMMATEMPAAIRPYSIAVAPLSSFTNRYTILVILCSLVPLGLLFAGGRPIVCIRTALRLRSGIFSVRKTQPSCAESGM